MTSVQLSVVQMGSSHLQPSANIDLIEAWLQAKARAVLDSWSSLNLQRPGTSNP